MMFRGRNYAVPQNPMMMRGRGRLGDTTTTATPGTFVTGAETWMSPSAGLTAAEGLFSNFSTSFASANLPYTLGILAVPAALVLLILSMSKGGKK